MKIGRVFLDLLSPLSADIPFEEGLARTLRRLVQTAGASAGLLTFQPPRGHQVTVAALARGASPAVEAALRDHLRTTARTTRRSRMTIPDLAGGRSLAFLRAPLGGRRRVGEIALAGSPRTITRRLLPRSFPSELGAALERVWSLHRRAIHIQVLNVVTELGSSRHALDEVLDVFVDGLARLVDFDAIGVALRDTDRDPPESVDLLGSTARASERRLLRLDGALLGRMVTRIDPLLLDDVETSDLAEPSRERLRAEGCRAVLLVPLVSRAGVFGAVALGARRPGAFDATDVEIAVEIARPVAAAIEQHRLVDETRRRAEELAALVRTSQLITARLHLASVLDQISRAVSALIGSTGCGIGLLDERRENLVHAAAHGFKTDAWRALSMPVGEGISGRCAASGVAIRVSDIRTDPRSARRDIDEQEGIRAMLCVPLKDAGQTIGVISAFSTHPGVFTAHHQHLLEAFGEQAGIAIHNAQLFEQSERRARETRALLEAGRAVTASLDVGAHRAGHHAAGAQCAGRGVLQRRAGGAGERRTGHRGEPGPPGEPGPADPHPGGGGHRGPGRPGAAARAVGGSSH